MRANIKSYSILTGTIIGAGIFGVPYVIARSGILSGTFLFIGVGIIMVVMHLMFGEVVLATKEKHRLPGFVAKYLGPRWSTLAKISGTLGLFGSLAAYIILGGKFAFLLGNSYLGGTELTYQLIYAFIFGAFIFLGTNPVARVEETLTASLLGFLGLLTIAGFTHFDLGNLPVVSANIGDAFLPYGVLLFAFSGLTAIPEMVDVLNNKERRNLKKIIIQSVLFCIIMTMLFVISAVGLSGSAVSPEAIQSFADALGPWALIVGSIIGFLAVSTSLLVIGLYLVDLFKYDLGWNHNKSFLVTMLPPVIVLFLTQNFILVMSLVGAILSPINWTLIVSVWRKTKTEHDREPEYRLRLSKHAIWLLVFVFIVGAIQEIISILN